MTSSEQAAVLRRAAELVERGWCQNTAARDSLGLPVLPYAVGARAWCLEGAIRAATKETPGNGRTVHHFMRRKIGKPLFDWNDSDGRTQAEVVAVLRDAAAELEGDDGRDNG